MNPYRVFLSTTLAAAIGLPLCASPATAQSVSLDELRTRTHFHGIAVDPADATRVLLATHHGFFVVGRDGRATRVSRIANDFMGFTPHPTDPAVLFASGHPPGGGNLGFIASRDGGRSWKKLSDGVGGPVDFHQMDVSKADPRIVYGAFRGLQVSRDGGRSWKVAGPLPDGLIDLAASAIDAERVYAATKSGLEYSVDGGKVWRPAAPRSSPATLVQTGHSGEIYAFVLGAGLLRAREQDLEWKAVADGFGRQYVIHLAVASGDPDQLYVVTNKGVLAESADGGGTWDRLGAGGKDNPPAARRPERREGG